MLPAINPIDTYGNCGRKATMGITCVTVKLTKAVVDAAKPAVVNGTVRQKIFGDSVLTGFFLSVGPKSKTFYAKRKINGRAMCAKIERYGVVTVDEARERARDLLAQMGKGIDPTREKRRQSARGITLGEAWRLYETTMKSKQRSENTLRRYEQCLDLYLSDWLTRPLADITRKEIHERHQRLANDIAAGKYAQKIKHPKLYGKKAGSRVEPFNRTGHATANHTFRVFRAIWNRARKQHPELPENPSQNVDWFKVRAKRNPLPVALLPKWRSGIAKLDNAVKRDYLMLLMLTGLRRESAASLRWEDVDFGSGILRIRKPKGGAERAFDLPITGPLRALLAARKEDNEVLAERGLLPPESPFVFPANASASGHIEEARAPLSAVTYRARDNDRPFRIHDIRATYITVAESLDISAYALKALVNHSQPKDDVTGGYINITAERLRAPAERVAARIVELTGANRESPA